MIRDGKVIGSPLVQYKDTKANIEALTGIDEGATAYATDTNELGSYDGAAWDWGGGGGAVDSVNGLTGVVVLDYSDVGADPAGSAATAEDNAKDYADGLVTGLWDDRGSYDASGGAYPSSGGSGTAGAILKGDIWIISVAGTLPTGQVVEVGDTVRALVNTPGNTQANWAIAQNNIGYVAENSANKATSMTGNETSNIVYLTAKAIYDWAIGLFEVLSNKVTTIVGNEADDNKFPTTSAVYDFALKRHDNSQVIIGEQVSIADDSVYSFTPPTSAGVIIVQSRSAASTNYFMGFFVTSAGGSFSPTYSIGSNVNLTTGTLTGTTGTDGKLTLSVNTTTGIIYIENRTNQSRNIVIKCL